MIRTGIRPSVHAGTQAAGHGSGPLARTAAVLEFVADHGGATAREVSDGLGYPMPSVYRLANLLIHTGYLRRAASGRELELGHAPRRLAAALNRSLSAPPALGSVITALHRQLRMAAYLTVHRAGDVVIVDISDCPKHPAVRPRAFGFHMAAHATAFGKVMLASMSESQRDLYLAVHGTPPVQAATITDKSVLAAHLDKVMLTGIAWEHGEFLTGTSCAAAAVHNPAGLVVGSVAVSGTTRAVRSREDPIEQKLRTAANEVSRYFRTGPSHVP